MRGLVAVCFALCVAGCGDDDGASDAAPPGDASATVDAGVIGCGDAAQCADLEHRLVCDPDRSACVECTFDDDCAVASALGSRCDLGRGACACASDADCAGKDRGPVCLAEASACGCITDDDCAGDRRCELTPYLGAGLRTCVVAPTR